MSEESNLSDVTSQESNITNYDTDDTVRTSSTRPIETTRKSAVLTDDESILKFTQGRPIIDQRNPFKKNNKSYDKISSATKIPQLKREKYKNAVNALKKSTSDDLITTEEVLRQSKYVKTYIKNPDPYFVYDPAILERIREEELKRKEEIKAANKENIKALKKKLASERQTKEIKTVLKSKIPYKKCSKPNYPDLADIKVKVGTDIDGTYLNPTEVKTNVKKFDECVKKKHFNFDEDSEDMEEHLPKNSSSEDVTTNNQNETHSHNQPKVNNDGSFTNTINSKDFQQYLVKKGLVLAPQQLVNEAKTTRIYTAPPKPNRIINIYKAPEQQQSSFQSQRPPNTQSDTDSEGTPKKVKKSSLLQRLLANNIFSARRKTTPKEPVPKPRSLYDADSSNVHLTENQRQLPLTKRIVLERKIEPDKYRSTIINSISSPMLECDTVDSPMLRRQPTSANTQQLQPNSNCEAYAKNFMMNLRNSGKTQAKTISLPHQPSLVQQRSLYGNQQVSTFVRAASMDRSEILRRSKATTPLRTLQIFNPSPNKSTTQNISAEITFEQHGPKTTSTPIRPRSSTESQPQHFASSSTIASSLYDDDAHSNPKNSKNDWLRLREQQQLQQSTDRELYTNVLNQKPQNIENLYERLPIRHIEADHAAIQPIYSSLDQRCYFVRGDQQRNTFCGSRRDPNYKNYINIVPAAEQAQSENNFQLSHVNVLERNQPSRLSTNTLSREEIIEKVKQFCRNSMRRKAEMQKKEKSESTAETPLVATKVSPASYDTVEGVQQLRPAERKPSPQVPHRLQSLKRNPEPAIRGSPTPVYANLWRENRMRHQADAPCHLQYLEAENIPYTFIERRVREGLATAPQYVSNTILESVNESVPRSSFENGRNLVRHSAKPPRSQSQQTVMPGRNFGRNTPLILERSQNLPSQIYRPRYREAMAQHNLDNRLLVQTNPSSGQRFSGSLSFQPFEYVEQLNDGRVARQMQPISMTQFEAYMPKVAENKRRNNEERSLPAKEDWQNENNKTGRQPTNDQAVNDERRRSSRREDPRRHTLGGDMLQYGVMQGGQPQQRAMDLENQPVRSYAPVNQGPLFDDDPGIMSEVETASTGFRRGGKQRSSLPVVRTPSKTLERPLGLVFLQYRSETKRALLPNEITSIDTVRALFVRSFPRQLTMAYLEGPNVKIYIHDASKDMFYELEDVRSHLREIRDRSVLRLFESNEVAAPPQVLPGGPGIPQPLPQAVPMQWDQDQSYFSEPEFDSEYQHQHIHKSKPGKQPPYYVGASQTLPRGMYSDRNKVAIGAPAKPLRSYGSRGNMGPIFPYPPDQLYSIPDGYTSSPERGARGSYEEPYYSQYGTRGNVVAPIIDEENSEVAMTEDQYALYGMKMGPGRIPRTANQMYDPTRPEDLHRIRVEHMERQLANLTGLVQKALVNQNPQITPSPVPTLNPNYLGVPAQCRDAIEELYGLSGGSHITIQANGTGEEIYVREKAPKLGKSSCHKSVSFEKSVSFSDDIQGVPKSHSPQHAADTKPTKPAIKSSTLPRTSSQERDRLKPPPPPKPIALTQTHSNYRADIALAPEVYNHLRGLQKKAKDLRMEVRTLRRLSQAQAVAVREDIKDAFMRIRATLLASSGNYWDQQGDQEKTRISREEELYKQEIIRLEKDLSDLESSVEGLRGEVINRRTRVNMAAVEDMALVLSRASKTVAELKLRFPGLSNGIRNLISNEMEKVVREEKFLKEEPDRLESALRRCKKLTGTLVTLKRLASVQEQRLPPNEPTANEDSPCSAEISTASKQPVPTPRMGPIAVGGGIPPENALDALLDELQTFAKPLHQHNDFRPDESTSDDSSQAILSTVTTQIPQACLYNPNDPNAAQQPNEIQEPQTGALAGTPLNHSMSNANMLQVNANLGSLRRLHSYPSGSDTDTSPPQPARLPCKPPVPERNAELLSKVGNKRIPPPPPPRTSSRSPLASPTSPNVPHRMPSLSETETLIGNGAVEDGSGNSSGNESGNDQIQRQVALERRHQELLRKQKMLQEQYQRLQQMSKMPAVATMPPPPTDIMQLKKTGSESNLPHKMDLSIASATGSMKNLNAEAQSGSVNNKNEKNIALVKQQMMDAAPKTASPKLTGNDKVTNNEAEPDVSSTNNTSCTTIKQVYETEIL